MRKESGLRLAIDAGATHSRFALFTDPAHPLRTSSCRGFNYTLQGIAGLEALFASIAGSGITAEGVAVVGLAAAGAGRPEVRSRALRDLEEIRLRFMPRAALYLFHDGESALYRALGTGEGVVVAAGTGSIGYGRSAGGREARAGGWGHLVGDEGSGWWIARQGLACALRSFDGRAPDTALGAALTAAAGCGATQELVGWLHEAARSKDEVAALAGVVVDLAVAGDATARRICAEAGEELAFLAEAVSRRLGFGDAPRVGLTGGVLLGSAPVREATVAALVRMCPGALVTLSSREPEIGAALLLADRMGKAPPDLEPSGSRDR